MSHAARIANGVVTEVIVIPVGLKLNEMFHPDAGFVECASDIEVGQTYADGVFGPKPAPVIVQYVPPSISDRQFFQQLAVEGIITQDEALAAVQSGTIPPALNVVIDGMPEADRFNAKMLIGGAVSFERNHPLTATVAAAVGMTETEVDDFFRAAAQL